MVFATTRDRIRKELTQARKVSQVRDHRRRHQVGKRLATAGFGEIDRGGGGASE
jgi:hypothetical protein